MASKIWDTHFAFFGLEKTANKAEVNHAYRSLLAEIETRDIPVSEKLEEIKRIDKIYEALIRLVAGEDEKEIDLEILTSRSCLEVLEEPQLLYALLSIRCCKNENNPVKRRKKICFLVDRSTSMQGDHINMVKANIERAIESLDEEDEDPIVTFNDRAEIMLPLTAVRALRKGFLWNLTKTGGATEIYYGISAGLDQLMKVDVSECSRHLFLFTDGRTYGDEGACLELSKRAWEHQIPISTFGLGSEWNDEFLDQIAANSGGATEYITSNKDLKHHLEKHIYAMSDVMIRGLEIKYRLPDGANLLFGYLISQKPSQLILDGLLQIGSLHFREHVQVILEFLVAPTTQQDGLLKIFSGDLTYQDSKDKGNYSLTIDLSLPVVKGPPSEYPDNRIISALSNVMLYRLQSKARAEIEKNNTHDGTKHLQFLATHMLSRGEHTMAHEILHQVRKIRQNEQTDGSMEKRIKYGTRALIPPMMTG